MPPRRTRLAFPKSVMKKGFTVLPNALDDFGLGPYHYRVLVFIIRWMGKATPDKPSFPISVEYIARMTCIGVSKVKEVIHDLEDEYHLIAVHRRKRLRNLYDIRPLFSVLLKNQSGPKEQAAGSEPVPTAETVVGGDDDAEAADADAEEERAGDRDVSTSGGREDEDDGFDEHQAAAHQPRRPAFGRPSCAPDDRIYPGEDDDPTWVEEREEQEVKEACERGEYIPGVTSEILWEGTRTVVPRDALKSLYGVCVLRP